MIKSVSSAMTTVFWKLQIVLPCAPSIDRHPLRMMRHTSFKLGVPTQHVDDIMFVCNIGKEDIFRRRQLQVFSE